MRELKQQECLALAEAFKLHEGRYPTRSDWRGENLAFFRERHQVKYPSERQVQRIFGNWGTMLVQLGELPKSTKETADIAIQHVATRYASQGVEIMPGRSGTIDCFIGEERVEVKGATVGKDDVIRTPRWRFRLHSREYSKLVDKLILVGLVNQEPVIEWALDKVGMYLEADKLDSLGVPMKNPFQNKMYNLYLYETWRADYTYEELLDLSQE